MLLLVAGLVVIVLVILVVVFLSVRSMRAEEGNDRPARSAGRDRAGRGDVRRGDAGRQPARRRPAEDDWLADDEPDLGEPEHDQARGSLPRPRGHQHDEDPGRGRGRRSGPMPGAGSGRNPASRAAGSGRDKSGADWLTGDWGGVSDEQYWAELSADKPLATTARSAQAGRRRAAGRSHLGTERRTRIPLTRRPQVTPGTGPDHGRHGAVHRPVQPPSRVRAARPPAFRAGHPPAPARTVRFRRSGRHAPPATSPEPWADPMSTGSVDTDPSIGMGGWQDAAGDTAGWQTPDRDEPADAGLTGMDRGPADQPVVLGAELLTPPTAGHTAVRIPATGCRPDEPD